LTPKFQAKNIRFKPFFKENPKKSKIPLGLEKWPINPPLNKNYYEKSDFS